MSSTQHTSQQIDSGALSAPEALPQEIMNGTSTYQFIHHIIREAAGARGFVLHAEMLMRA